MDPSKVAREVIRLVGLYDKVQHPEKVTLKSKWHEIGKRWATQASTRSTT